MTTEHKDWDSLRDYALREFGNEIPKSVDEQVIADRFRREPVLVTNAVERIAENKKIDNPWAMLDYRTRTAISQLGSLDESARRKAAIERAVVWTSQTGYQFPFEAFEEELYGGMGSPGRLRAYAEDSALRETMAELWRSRQVENGAPSEHRPPPPPPVEIEPQREFAE